MPKKAQSRSALDERQASDHVGQANDIDLHCDIYSTIDPALSPLIRRHSGHAAYKFIMIRKPDLNMHWLELFSHHALRTASPDSVSPCKNT